MAALASDQVPMEDPDSNALTRRPRNGPPSPDHERPLCRVRVQESGVGETAADVEEGEVALALALAPRRPRSKCIM